MTKQPAALLPATVRIASAFAVAALVATTWMAAGHESEKAVQASAAAMSAYPAYVTLPSVEIVGQREVPQSATALASVNTMHATNEL